MNKGFSLLEIVIYVSLLSVLGYMLFQITIQTQVIFMQSSRTFERVLLRRYISLVVLSEVKTTHILHISGGEELQVDNNLLVDIHSFQRMEKYIGDITQVIFTVDLLTRSILVTYKVQIGTHTYDEQVRIYLI